MLRIALVPLIVTSTNTMSEQELFEVVETALAVFPGVELVPEEDSGKFIQCADDLRCQSARLNQQAIQFGLTIVLDFSTEPPVLTGQLFSAEETKILDRTLKTLKPPISEVIIDAVRAAFRKTGHPEGGVVITSVDPADATVSVLGRAHEAGGRIRLPAGTHELLIQRDGYDGQRLDVVITRGDVLHLDPIRLIEQPPLVEAWWLWTLIGVAVAGAAATTGVLVHRSRQTRQIEILEVD